MQIETKSVVFRVSRVYDEGRIGERLEDTLSCNQVAVIRCIGYIVVVRTVYIEAVAWEEWYYEEEDDFDDILGIIYANHHL